MYERINGNGEVSRPAAEAGHRTDLDEQERFKEEVLSQAARGSVRMIASAPATPGVKRARKSGPAQPHAKSQRGERATRGEWLSPFELSAKPTSKRVPRSRASNTGCLALTFAEYLQLVDWTGREIRADKRGAISKGIAPILERLSVTSEGWLKLVTEFSRLFRRSAGTPASLGEDAAKRGHKRREGISNSRAVFVSRV